jgi:predicted nucleic acid-binding Zn ribbon protein
MDAKRKRHRCLLLTYIILELVVLMVLAYDDIAHLLGY